MLNRINQLGLTIAVVAFAGLGTAHAQDEDMDNPCGDDMDNPCEDTGDDGMEEGNPCEANPCEGGEEASDASDGESMGSAGWPQEIIMRPLTLPASAIGVSGTITTTKFDVINLGGGPLAAFFGQGISGVQGTYGISDVLQVRGGYSLALKEFEAKGSLDVGADYSILRGDGLDLNGSVTLGYNLLGEALNPLNVGVNGRYRLNDKMAVTYAAGVTAFLEELAPDVKPIFLSVPIGFAYQVNPNIYATVGTQLAVIEIADFETGFIAADFLPLDITGYYSMDNTLDIGAGITIGDLTDEPAENWGILLTGRYYMGVN